jgi:hypothetical protein
VPSSSINSSLILSNLLLDSSFSIVYWRIISSRLASNSPLCVSCQIKKLLLLSTYWRIFPLTNLTLLYCWSWTYSIDPVFSIGQYYVGKNYNLIVA